MTEGGKALHLCYARALCTASDRTWASWVVQEGRADMSTNRLVRIHLDFPLSKPPRWRLPCSLPVES